MLFLRSSAESQLLCTSSRPSDLALKASPHDSQVLERRKSFQFSSFTFVIYRPSIFSTTGLSKTSNRDRRSRPISLLFDALGQGRFGNVGMDPNMRVANCVDRIPTVAKSLSCQLAARTTSR